VERRATRGPARLRSGRAPGDRAGPSSTPTMSTAAPARRTSVVRPQARSAASSAGSTRKVATSPGYQSFRPNRSGRRGPAARRPAAAIGLRNRSTRHASMKPAQTTRRTRNLRRSSDSCAAHPSRGPRARPEGGWRGASGLRTEDGAHEPAGTTRPTRATTGLATRHRQVCDGKHRGQHGPCGRGQIAFGTAERVEGGTVEDQRHDEDEHHRSKERERSSGRTPGLRPRERGVCGPRLLLEADRNDAGDARLLHGDAVEHVGMGIVLRL